MKTLQKLMLGGLLAIALSFASCGKDDNPVSCNWAVEVQAKLDALIAASTLYYSDTNNSANCNAYKVAYQAYLNDIKDHRDCAFAAGQGATIDAEIAQAQADIDLIQC